MIAAFFAAVLGLCAELGMGKLGVVALDGTKVAASASKSANRTEDRLRTMAAETVAAHAASDAAEDDLFGQDARGDEVPGDAWSPRRRDERIAAALASLTRKRAAAAAQRDKTEGEHLADAAAGRRRGRHPAAARMSRWPGLPWSRPRPRSRRRSTTGTRGTPRRWPRLAPGCATRRGGRPASSGGSARRRRSWRRPGSGRPRPRPGRGKQKNRAGPGPVGNVTDPDSRLMPVRGGGFIQGYNAQVVTTEDGLIIATRLTGTTGDATWLEPMMTDAEDAAALITATAPASPATAAAATVTTTAAEGRSGCSWPTPGTAPKPTSPSPARTG